MLPDNILKRMSKEDRAKMGLKTAAEAEQSFEVRSEKDLQKLIHSELLRREIPNSWNRMDKKTGNTLGWPDFTFPIPPSGRFAFIEAKVKGGTLSDDQSRVIDSLRDSGAVGIVAYDFPSVKAFLDFFALSDQSKENMFAGVLDERGPNYGGKE